MTSPSTKRKLRGTIVSTDMMKTVVVAVTRLKLHPKYKQRYRVTKRFKAHVATEAYKVGDVVTIEETRPISKDKRWKILQKLTS